MGPRQQTLQAETCIILILVQVAVSKEPSRLGALLDGRLSCYASAPDLIASPQPSLRCTEYRPAQNDEGNTSSAAHSSFTPMDQREKSLD